MDAAQGPKTQDPDRPEPRAQREPTFSLAHQRSDKTPHIKSELQFGVGVGGSWVFSSYPSRHVRIQVSTLLLILSHAPPSCSRCSRANWSRVRANRGRHRGEREKDTHRSCHRRVPGLSSRVLQDLGPSSCHFCFSQPWSFTEPTVPDPASSPSLTASETQRPRRRQRWRASRATQLLPQRLSFPFVSF